MSIESNVSDDAPPLAEPENVFKELADGRLAEEFGLTAEQLSIGLTVARNHLARGALVEAYRIYVSLVLCDPLNVEFQIGLSECAGVLGEQHVAIQAASTVVALAPCDPRGYLLSGRGCIMIGSYEEAREDLNDARKYATAGGNDEVATEAEQLLKRLAVAPHS